MRRRRVGTQETIKDGFFNEVEFEEFVDDGDEESGREGADGAVDTEDKAADGIDALRFLGES